MGKVAKAAYALSGLALVLGLEAPAYASPSPSVASEYLIARDAESRGDWTTAAAMFGDVWARSQDDKALRQAFLFALGAGDIPSALRLSASITPGMPEKAVSAALQTADAIRRGDRDAALKYLATLPDDGLSGPLGGLLAAWLAASSPDKAVRAGALAHLDAASDFDALTTLHAALIKEMMGDPAGADAAYARLVQTSEAPRLLALARDYYMRTGQKQMAEKVVAHLPEGTSRLVLASLATPAARVAAPTLASGASEAFHDMAEILLDGDHPDVALFYAQISVALSPATPDSHFLLGEIMQAEGRYGAAATELSHASAGSSFGLLAKMDAALDLQRVGDPRAAEASLAALVKAYPALPEPAINLAEMLRRDGGSEQAAALYGRALVHMPADDPDRVSALFGQAIAYDNSGKPGLAESKLKQAIALDPDQPLVLNYLGYFWVTRGEHIDEALGFLEHAYELQPGDPAIADSLGWALYRQGAYTAAADKLLQAVEGSPASSIMNAHLGDAYWQMGRKTEARYQWQRALANANPRDIAALQSRLDSGLPDDQLVVDARHAEADTP
jgi:tetratricopeptide (TPR) repeat protein